MNARERGKWWVRSGRGGTKEAESDRRAREHLLPKSAASEAGSEGTGTPSKLCGGGCVVYGLVLSFWGLMLRVFGAQCRGFRGWHLLLNSAASAAGSAMYRNHHIDTVPGRETPRPQPKMPRAQSAVWPRVKGYLLLNSAASEAGSEGTGTPSKMMWSSAIIVPCA